MLVYDQNEIVEMLMKQLSNYGWKYDEGILKDNIPIAMQCVEESMAQLATQRFVCDNNILFSPYHSVSYSVFLYYLSNILGKKGTVGKAKSSIT